MFTYANSSLLENMVSIINLDSKINQITKDKMPLLILPAFAKEINMIRNSVADPDPGSGNFLTPGSGIRNMFFPDPRSRILDPGSRTHVFESLVTIFSVKSSIIL